MDSRSLDGFLDRLVPAHVNGLLAMDPLTTFPFWDYDLAPLLSQLWIDEMLQCIRAARNFLRTPSDWLSVIEYPSIARKELMYSLFDMKVRELCLAERLEVVSFWTEALSKMCGSDAEEIASNRCSLRDCNPVSEVENGFSCDFQTARVLGALTVALHATSYALYSDVFTHQCAEVRGPYPDLGTSGVIIVREWKDLNPTDLWPDLPRLGFDRIRIATRYDGLDITVDPYNHASWTGVAPEQLTRAQIHVDGVAIASDKSMLWSLASAIASRAARQHEKYSKLALVEKKVLWVQQRRYQFRGLFDRVGVSRESREMERAVASQDLHCEPYWSINLPRPAIDNFMARCLDPRIDLYYREWRQAFEREISGPAGGREPRTHCSNRVDAKTS